VQGYAVPRNLFFLAADSAGMAQVWQLPPSGNPPLQLTQAEAAITGYTVSLDGSLIAYSSAGQLWLQPIGGSGFTVNALENDGNANPDFSPDGQTLAYVDGGIRTFSLSAGTTTVYLQDDPTTQYQNPRFSPNGAFVMMDITTSSTSTGILDLASGEVQLFPDGYGNGRWLGVDRVMTFGSVLQAGAQRGIQFTQQGQISVVLPDSISVADAITVANGQREDIRLIVRESASAEQLRVYDFRQPAGLVPLVEGGFVEQARLAPDGSVVVGLVNTGRADSGELQGQLTFVNVFTGEQLTLATPQVVSQVKWQR
jgi:dipeptidyl aminopeptidase/acylaminoacyl peptidase